MTAFELTIVVPSDARFGGTVAAVASQAARQAGCDETRAAAFGADVADAVGGCVTAGSAGGGGDVTIVLRRRERHLEIALTCGTDATVARTLRIDV